MTRVVIDPITRIEGHLRIEVEVEGGRVTEAWSSGTMYRGLERILQGRDPRDAWLIAQRACGVCTTVHALASVRAVERALGIHIPPNARLVRNLIAASQFVHDHVVHFYHLHALDWVDLVAALQADPGRTAALAETVSDAPLGGRSYFADVRGRLQALVDSGQLGLFANAYWGHPAYALPPEANLLAVAHYLAALDWQRSVVRIQALLGGKNPHPQSYCVGGMAMGLDPNSPTALTTRRLSEIRQLAEQAIDFVERIYLPDVLFLAEAYRSWFSVGRGVGNFLVYGDFPEDDSDDPAAFYLPRGRLVGGDLARVAPVDQLDVGETVAHSWYRYHDDDAVLRHPFEGETEPTYSGPQPPYERIETPKYSWLKAPRYRGEPMEVGPLARLLVGYAAGHEDVRREVEAVRDRLRLPHEALVSTFGRVVARAVETKLLARRLLVWLDALAANLASGDLAVADVSAWDPRTWPAEAKGWGLEEAPRGALGHWIVIRDQKIANYQLVVPSTWNGSPRDAAGRRGPWEEALVGTPLADPRQPLEILRTLHAFDPCMACAVHVHDPAGGSGIEVRVA
jgi:Ni,Fe-hydrogenase I large subunit